ETHIEPLETHEMHGEDASRDIHAAVTAILIQRAAETGLRMEPHNVRVRQTRSGLIINYHCRLDPGLSVSDAHRLIDALDREVKNDYPGAVRVVGHAEPLGGGQEPPSSDGPAIHTPSSSSSLKYFGCLGRDIAAIKPRPSMNTTYKTYASAPPACLSDSATYSADPPKTALASA